MKKNYKLQNTNDQNKKKFKASYNAVFVLNFENLNFGFVSNFMLHDFVLRIYAVD